MSLLHNFVFIGEKLQHFSSKDYYWMSQKSLGGKFFYLYTLFHLILASFFVESSDNLLIHPVFCSYVKVSGIPFSSIIFN